MRIEQKLANYIKDRSKEKTKLKEILEGNNQQAKLKPQIILKPRPEGTEATYLEIGQN